MLEMAYSTGRIDSMETNPQRLVIGRFLPRNRWEVVWSDTCHFPELPGINRAYFMPSAFGDPDRDGLTDVLGGNWVFGDTWVQMIDCNLEQRLPGTVPDSSTWYYIICYWTGSCGAPIYSGGSLDPDNSDDFLDMVEMPGDNPRTVCIENSGNDLYQLSWEAPNVMSGTFAIGDFNADTHTEFAGAYSDWTGYVSDWQAATDNRYECIFSDSVHLPNGAQNCFSGRDVNQNGKPEFFIEFARYVGANNWMCYLFMWESDGGAYRRVCVDSTTRYCVSPFGHSLCADIDGDGVEEVIWSTTQYVTVYKAAPGGLPERVYECNGPNPADPQCANVNVADVNYDGYNELVVTDGWKMNVLEVEAIRVVEPNGGGAYVPGDTCHIRWQTYAPPRCDSVSLFLRRDSTWQLDTIAHGLPSGDSTFDWVVPNTPADSARIVAIAYGPGRQYDESDTTFQIQGSGIGEEKAVRIPRLSLSVTPNPARGSVQVKYEVPTDARVELSLVDVSGREVATLSTGTPGPGEHQATWNRQDAGGRELPAGIYFVRLRAGGDLRVAKLVLTDGGR